MRLTIELLISTIKAQNIKSRIAGKDRTSRGLALRPRCSRGASKEEPYLNQSKEIKKANIARGIGFFILAKQLR